MWPFKLIDKSIRCENSVDFSDVNKIDLSAIITMCVCRTMSSIETVKANFTTHEITMTKSISSLLLMLASSASIARHS